MRGLSPVAASGGHSSSRCAGLSLSRPLLLRSTGSRRASSVIVAHGPSCSAACGILPDQGSNPCPLHWQADSQPLHHQGSPGTSVLRVTFAHCRAGCRTWGTAADLPACRWGLAISRETVSSLKQIGELLEDSCRISQVVTAPQSTGNLCTKG